MTRSAGIVSDVPIVVMRLALDQHVADVLIGGGDDGAVLDQEAHGSSSAIGV